jgi:sec-independent protein translocase protein TatA
MINNMVIIAEKELKVEHNTYLLYKLFTTTISVLLFNQFIIKMTIFGLGTPELILILVVFLLFFGKDKLPELAKSVGRSFNALKEGFKDAKDEIESKPVDKTKK